MAGDFKNDDPRDLTGIFNALSSPDRAALRGAALVKSITGLAREDTKLRPWRYPLHAGVILSTLILAVTPGPVILPSLLMIGWIRLHKNKEGSWSQWAHRHIRDEYNEKAMVDNHRAFISDDPDKPGHFSLNKIKLAQNVAGCISSDSWQATKAAFSSLARLFSQDRKGP